MNNHKLRALMLATGAWHSVLVEFKGQDNYNFLSVTSTLYITVNSREGKGKALKEHILKDLLPRVKLYLLEKQEVKIMLVYFHL